MKNFLKLIYQSCCPPILYRLILGKTSAHENFPSEFLSWQDAENACTGYASQKISEKVLTAALKVKNGEFPYERDSVLFESIQYSWPVLSALLWAALGGHGKLSVLDFGGSLGTSYFQNKFFLQNLKKFQWSIVEQSEMAALGKNFIQSDQIKFYSTIEECLGNEHPNFILLSSVLQYINPYQEILRQLARVNSEYIILDRTPILKEGAVERIFKQVVPDSIYQASYPCRFFVEGHLINLFASLGYSLIISFDALDDLDGRAIWKGYIFKRNLIPEERIL